MNSVKIMAKQTEAQVSAPHVKGKKQTCGDFLEMLSSAITTKGTAAKPENMINQKDAAQTADKTEATNPKQQMRNESGEEVQDTEIAMQEEAPDEIVTAGAAAQMLIPMPMPMETQPYVADVTGEIPVQTVEQATPLKAWTTQPAYVQTEEKILPKSDQAQDTQKPEQADLVQPSEQNTEYKQTQPLEIQTRRDETGRAANAVQEPIVVREQPKVGSRVQGDTTAQRDPLPSEAKDTVVYTQTVSRTDNVIQPKTPIQTVNDAAQTKFDGMLAKASQELVQTQTRTEAVREQPLATDKPVLTSNEVENPTIVKQDVTVNTIPQDTDVQNTEPKNEGLQDTTPEDGILKDIAPQNTSLEDTTPEDAVADTEKKTTVKPAETMRESNTAAPRRESWQMESVRTHVPELREQKPVKEIRRDEETAVTNMVQPKPQNIPAHEVVRTENRQPAQQAKAPVQFEQIRSQVIRNIEDQRMEFSMQLHPEELGKVDVKMILEGGKLAIEIMAANAKSTEILHRQTESLVASLRLSNLEVTTVSVVTASQNASEHMNSEYNLNNFNGQSGQQDAQSSGTGADRRSSGSETADMPEGEVEERQPGGILNYSI